MRFPFQLTLNRSLWLKIHVYLALCLGFCFALMGLTGAICVYGDELDGFLNPSLVIESSTNERQSLDKIMLAIQKAHPNRYGTWTLEMPQSIHGCITAWFDKPKETIFENYAPLMVSINPYTAEVVANRFWGHTLITWIIELHTQFHLDRLGWIAVGLLGATLQVSILSGIYLWWPGWAKLYAAFKLHHDQGQMKLVFDLHRLMGLFLAAILLLLAFSGFQLSFPGVLETLVGSSGMAHGETGKALISTAIPNDQPTGLEAAQFIARGSFPHADLRRVTTPLGDNGTYRINLKQGFEVNQTHPFTTVWIDRWSGQIVALQDPARFKSGEALISWMWPLHTGEAYGSLGRFIWFLSGIGLFILYVTGLLHWLFRRGIIQDKAIDYKRLRFKLYAYKAAAYRIILMLLQCVRHRTPLFIDYLKSGYQSIIKFIN